MHTHGASLFAAVLAFALGLTPGVHAQAPSATVQGTVADESAAVVPGVQVTVLNVDTGVQRTRTSGEKGNVRRAAAAPWPLPGRRRPSGFAPTTMQAILNVGDAIDLKLVMKVAGVDASVLVTARRRRRQQLACRRHGDRSPVRREPAVERPQLPVVDRDHAGRGDDVGELDEPRAVQRQRPAAEHELLHGGWRQRQRRGGVGDGLGVAGAGAAPAVSAQGGTNSLVSIDALQEFKIETSTYAPEFGRTPGAQVSMVTRSGGNQYHGRSSNIFAMTRSTRPTTSSSARTSRSRRNGSTRSAACSADRSSAIARSCSCRMRDCDSISRAAP